MKRISWFGVLTGILLAFLSCNQGNLPPVAKLVAFPSAGDTSMLMAGIFAETPGYCFTASNRGNRNDMTS